jgi:hypothetical protein
MREEMYKHLLPHPAPATEIAVLQFNMLGVHAIFYLTEAFTLKKRKVLKSLIYMKYH